MDEMVVWNDMMSNATVEEWSSHSVNMKTTAYEKAKYRFA